MADNRITVELIAKPGDSAHVYLSDFTEQLNLVRAALRETERSICGDKKPQIEYRVVDLHHSRPTVVLEAESPDESLADSVARRFTVNLRIIKSLKKPPKRTDFATLESYREMASPLSKSVAEVAITAAKTRVIIDQSFQRDIEQAIGPDEITYGSVSGMMEAINLHNARRFTVYPIIGARKIRGTFSKDKRAEFKSGIDRYVTIYGRLRYKSWDKFPYEIAGKEIEVHPDERELPSLHSLRGLAPKLSGNVPSDEWLDSVRDEAW